MEKVERVQVHALKWPAHFNLSFVQVCDFQWDFSTGKPDPKLSRLDGFSHSAMENKQTKSQMPETVRIGHAEKGVMGFLGCSGAIRIKYDTEVKIQWKIIKHKKLLLSFSCPLGIALLTLPQWATPSLGKDATVSFPKQNYWTSPKTLQRAEWIWSWCADVQVAAIPQSKEWEHSSPSCDSALVQRKPLSVAVHILFCTQTYRNIYKIYLLLYSALLPT